MMRFSSHVLGSAVVVMVGLAAWAAKASVYSAAVLPDGPVAYYELSETSGTTAVNTGTGLSLLDGSTVRDRPRSQRIVATEGGRGPRN
jgi:hypothetical protein